jgi:3-hydroxyacyl-CoA dehydrogenase/enoyl-CoA hydratase/3-hydroxybutyryl-CoA epimerase
MGYKTWSALDDRALELGPDKPQASGAWKNWRLSLDDEGAAWLIADQTGTSVNTLSEQVLHELDSALKRLEQEAPKGLVIRSAKQSGFFAGADVSELKTVRDETDVQERLTRANAIVDRLAALPMPKVAVIHGHALGGGLELALACDHRIVAGEAKLGYPEVRLGLHPGLGGTARTLALIDALEAMQLLLTGKSLYAKKALALGLVDAVTEERHVRAGVRDAIGGRLKRHEPSLKERMQRPIFAAAGARKIAADRMRTESAKKAPPEHYPATGALIDLWEAHGDNTKAMRQAEIASFARLIVTDTAQNLIRLFLLREKMKDLTKLDEAPPLSHVHVIGAGAMGGDIAAWCAWHGLTATLTDPKLDVLADAVKRAAELFPRLGHDSAKTRDALDRLIPDVNGKGAARADIVIEAVPEKPELKKQIYAELEPKLKPHAVLATNTSSLQLEDLRQPLRRPGRLIGLHFFNPVSRLELVEIVSHDKVEEDALRVGRAFLGRIDRIPAPVRSAPGFVVNRALTPYMLEAMVLMQEGHAKETIDAAAERFGMPVGPVTLADQVGLDICMDVAHSLRRQLDRPLPAPPDWLREKIEQGALGKKSGKGLYEWKNGEPLKNERVPEPAPDLIDRMILPMIDACLECLRKGVISDEDFVDGAMVFGTGFAPFRGGPMHYARAAGAAALHQRMQALAETVGERFRPDPGWERIL